MKITFLFNATWTLVKFFWWYFPKNLYLAYFRPYKNPFFTGNFGPVPIETVCDQLEVEGKLPLELDGVFVRNGPNPQFGELKNHHWFDGDGMLHCVYIANGKASYRNTFVRTERLVEERAYGAPIYGKLASSMNPSLFFLSLLRAVGSLAWGKLRGAPPPPPGPAIKGTANTSVEYHAGRLLALLEADAPYHVRLPDLTTVGRYFFDGKLTFPFTAHPKIDFETGEMIFFGYAFRPPYLTYGRVSAQGELVTSFPVELPVPVMMHDFAITENYAVFLDLPLTFRIGRMFKGEPPLAFEKDRRGRLGVLPRLATSDKDIAWFEIPTCFVYHTANAWETSDSKIVLIACRSAITSSLDPEILEGRRDLTPTEVLQNDPHLYRWEIDLKKKTVHGTQLLSGYAGEFPVINRKVTGKPTRFVWFALASKEDSFLTFGGVAKIDLQTGDAKRVDFGANKTSGEAIFVPRNPKAPFVPEDEDDGFLLVHVYDAVTKRSECWVIDARTLSDKPLAVIKISSRVPYGFHGIWVTNEQLLTQK